MTARFIALTYPNGQPVFVNVSQILLLEPKPLWLSGEPQPSQTRIYLALAGRTVADAGESESEPYHITVREQPEDVLALLAMRVERVPDTGRAMRVAGIAQ